MRSLPQAQAVRRSRRQAGFTLIELIVAVAIIGILAAIAYPAYQQQIRKSRRAEAQSFMMAVAARQQQFLLDTRAYAATVAGIGVPIPTAVSSHYTLTLAVTAGPPPTYTLTATPAATQAYETCGTLGIDQAGAKTASTGGCW
jgi:type IV pilus assembly protein PilE